MVNFNVDWFNKFTQSTNEKKLLVSGILDILKGKPHGNCLEIGLGASPYFAEQLSKNFGKYVIIERQPVKEQLPSGVVLINDDWEKINLDEKYDVIIASHVVSYFKDKKSAIDKMLAALTDNGRAIFVVHGKGGDYCSLRLAFSKMIGLPYVFSYDILLEALRGRKIKEYVLSPEIQFSSFEELFNTLRLSFDNCPTEYQKFKTDIIRYLQQNITGNKFIVKQRIIEVEN